MDRPPTRYQWETMGTPGGVSYVFPAQWSKPPYVPKADDNRDPLWVRVLANAVIISALVLVRGPRSSPSPSSGDQNLEAVQ